MHLSVGDVVEEVDEVVNPEDRTHVAITLPLAAGMEPLNPNIATAPAEAAPSAAPTLAAQLCLLRRRPGDVRLSGMAKGTTTLRFRTRAQVAGSFTRPPAQAETMYRAGIMGASGGQRIAIGR